MTCFQNRSLPRSRHSGRAMPGALHGIRDGTHANRRVKNRVGRRDTFEGLEAGRPLPPAALSLDTTRHQIGNAEDGHAEPPPQAIAACSLLILDGLVWRCRLSQSWNPARFLKRAPELRVMSFQEQ